MAQTLSVMFVGNPQKRRGDFAGDAASLMALRRRGGPGRRAGRAGRAAGRRLVAARPVSQHRAAAPRGTLSG
ncbi:MAG TPA: hypothetical protein VFU73_01665, partial [Actinocrinis sp.]|nr:hypothetical protein [Actinocrinis sp.]